MTSSLRRSVLLGVASFFVATAFVATAAQAVPSPRFDDLLSKKDMAGLSNLLAQGSDVDDMLKALLRATQTSMTADADHAAKLIALAGQNAAKMTPAGVAAVCADLRRVADSMPAGVTTSPLYTAVMNATVDFSKAPVVVSAGKPNLCEEAWTQMASMGGEDPLLAQQQGQRQIIIPPKPIPVPTGTPTLPPEKPPVDPGSPE